MKKLSVICGISLVISFAGGIARAQGGAQAAHPCHAIKKACEAAGYFPGQHKKDGKGLWLDCFDPIVAGKQVAGVSVSAAEAQECAAKKATFKRH